jgi:hypothetical protein
MAIKLEEMLNEFRYPSQITTDKAFATSGAMTVGGALTVTGVATFAGGSVLTSPLGVGSAGIKVGALTPPMNPTGTTGGIGCLFINTTATGVTNRIYVNTDGATAWTFITTGA